MDVIIHTNPNFSSLSLDKEDYLLPQITADVEMYPFPI